MNDKAQLEQLDIGQMPDGDYLIHVYVEKGKNFRVEMADANVGEQHTFSPLLKIKCCDQTHYSSTIKGAIVNSDQDNYWGEHFFFEPKKISGDYIQQQTLTIQCLDKGFLKNHSVGCFDIDIAQIYHRDPQFHCIQHQWVALYNKGANKADEIKGQLKISIAVCGPDDQQIKLEDEGNNTLESSKDTQILMPSSLRKDFKQLTIAFFQGQEFPKTDHGQNWTDPYIRCKWHKEKYQTDVVKYDKSKQRCDFNQVFKIPLEWPSATDRLTLEIKDHDSIIEKAMQGGTDDVIGSIVLSIKDLHERAQSGLLVWKNIYGAHEDGKTSETKEKMNSNPELGTCFKGRILLHIQILDVEKPSSEVCNVGQSALESNSVKRANAPKKFQIISEVGAGMNLPDDQKYQVQIQIGNEYVKLTDKPKEQMYRFCRWSQRFNGETVLLPYASVDTLEKIFIYLVDEKGQKVCFWKGRARDFRDKACKMQWHTLSIDHHIGKVTEPHKAGLIQFKLAINCLEENPEVNWNDFQTWKEPPPRFYQTSRLRCYIYQCKDLPSADADGACDSRVTLYNPVKDNRMSDDEHFKRSSTAVQKDNLNPVFHEAIDIYCFYAKRDQIPPIIIDVFDRDEGYMNDSYDFLGRAFIKFQDTVHYSHRTMKDIDFDSIPGPPRWHEIRTGASPHLPVCGKILCSFALVDHDYAFKVRNPRDVELNLNTKRFNVDVHVLGLRDLQSFGMIPVRKAFCKFNVRSLLPAKQLAASITNIRIDPRECGPNPNINTLVSFNVDLPSEYIFIPKLACECFDFVCKGLSQPKLGQFEIDMGQIRRDKLNVRDNMFKAINHLIDKLNKKLGRHPDHRHEVVEIKSQGSHSCSDDELEDHNAEQIAQLRNLYAGAFGIKDVSKDIKKDATSAQTERVRKGMKRLNTQMKSELHHKAHQMAQHLNVKIEEKKSRVTESLSRTPTSQQISFDPLGSQGVTNRSKSEMKTSLSGVGKSFQTGQEDYASEEYYSEDDLAFASKSLSHKKVLSEISYVQESTGIIKMKESLNKYLINMMSKTGKLEENVLQGMLDKIQAQEDDKNNNTNVIFKKQQQQNIFKDQQNHNEVELEKLLHQRMSEIATKNQQTKKDLDKKAVYEAEFDMILQGRDIHEMVLHPMYEKGDSSRLLGLREVNKPNEVLYEEVGHDFPHQRKVGENTNGNKHYRRTYMDELEKNDYLMARKPFIMEEIRRGQKRGQKPGLFEALFHGGRDKDISYASSEKVVGLFKGHIMLSNKEEEEEHLKKKGEYREEVQELMQALYQKKFKQMLGNDAFKNLDTVENMLEFKSTLVRLEIFQQEIIELFQEESSKKIQKALQMEHNCSARLYILYGYNFSSRDLGSHSDPYLIVKQGKTTYNRRDKYQTDEPNPLFHEMFEFKIKLPGTQPIEIEAWDYDMLFGDDLIGKSILRLDERFFSPDWYNLKNKPIEHRELHHPSTNAPQGYVVSWLDIIDRANTEEMSYKWNVKPEPQNDYELRVAVYHGENIKIDDTDGCSDVFVKAWLSSAQESVQETDTHWRDATGSPSFNWRLLFPFTSPKPKGDEHAYVLNLEFWDRDLLSSDDFLAHFNLDLRQMVLDCRQSQLPIHLDQKYYNTFMKDALKKKGIKTKIKFDFDGDSFYLSTPTDQSRVSRVRLDVRVIPGQEAKAQPLGRGRCEPNNSPVMQHPHGRLQLTMNPFSMVQQVIGPDYYNTAKDNICKILCAGCCVLLLPMVASGLIQTLILKVCGV